MDDVALVMTLCTWLDAAGVGAWRPDGPAYAGDEVGVFYGALDTGPDRAVGVTVYATDDDVALGTALRWVQVRYRGAPGRPDGADVLAAAGFRALHGVHHRDGIARARRVSSAHLGADDSGRLERTDNYEITLNAAPGGTP
jgi:hypothetical protein